MVGKSDAMLLPADAVYNSELPRRQQVRVEDLLKYCREVGPDENCLRYTRPRFYLDNVQVGPDAANGGTISQKYRNKIKKMMSKTD